MRRDTLRIAAFTVAISAVLIVADILRTNGQQAGLLGPLDAKDPIPYFIANGAGVTGFHPSDRELAEWALQAWQRSSLGVLRFQPSAESSAIIRIYWAEPTEGQYGETTPITVSGKRGASVFIRPDMESLGPEIAQKAKADPLLRESVVYLTCLHELGHALGLEHTRDFRDIMYFFGYGGDIGEYFGRYRAQIHSRGDIANVAGLSDADVKRIRTIYVRE